MNQVVALLLALMLVSCTHVRSSQGVSLDAEGTWLVLPLQNRTATPRRGCGQLPSWKPCFTDRV